MKKGAWSRKVSSEISGLSATRAKAPASVHRMQKVTTRR